MNVKGRYLKSDQISVDKLTALSQEPWLKSQFGDPQRFPAVSGRLNELISLTKANVAKVMALGNDETRMPADLHHTAKTIAEATALAIRTVSAEVKAKGEDMMLAGRDMAEEAFAPRPGYSQLDSEIRLWMKEKVKSPEGLGEVAQMLKQEPAIAGIVYHSPHYLLGIAKTIQAKWQAEAVSSHLPKAAQMLEDGDSLVALSKKYEGVVRDIHQSFYDQGTADKMKTRVEV